MISNISISGCLLKKACRLSLLLVIASVPAPGGAQNTTLGVISSRSDYATLLNNAASESAITLEGSPL
jgi:hypothetical protein